MSQMRIVRSQKGAGMMMAMMAAAALAGAGFLMGDLFLNAEDVLKKDSRIVGYQLLVDTVRKNIYAGNNCTAVFGKTSPLRTSSTRTLITDALGRVSSAPVDVINLAAALDGDNGGEASAPAYARGVEVMGLPLRIDNTTTVLESNWKAKTGTSIKSMRLIVEKILKLPSPYTTEVRTVRYPSGGTSENLKAVEAYLVLEPDHKGVNVWAPENKKYWIKIYAYLNAANEIHSCYDPSSEAVFCTETMKGAYVNDPALPPEKRCRPDFGCFTYKSGVIPVGESCPDSDYRENKISTDFKTCTWCPSTAYTFPPTQGLTRFIGSIQDRFLDFGEEGGGPEVDCDAPNPWASMNNVEAYREYLRYRDIFQDPDFLTALSDEQRAGIQGCFDRPPRCADLPETCVHECTGVMCTCPTRQVDDFQAYIPDDDPGAGPPTPCFNECSGTAITWDPTPWDCNNECGGGMDYSCMGWWF
jgi:hypothetical protein